MMCESICIDCGRRKVMRARDIYNPKCNSCVCKNIKHGMHHSKIYSVYHNMKDRCYNPNHHEYHNYGGKGIDITPEWLGENGFIRFYDWAIRHGYHPGLTIDRIDSNSGYSPSNCQWITRSENTARANKNTQRRKADKGSYYGVSPNDQYYEFDNASEFARIHNLNAGCIRSVARGDKKSYKGWIFGYICDKLKEGQSTIEKSA